MVSKTSKNHAKHYDGKTKWIYFLTKVDNLLNKYNTIMHKIKADADENLMTNLYTLKTF